MMGQKVKVSVVILGWVVIWNCWNLKVCIRLEIERDIIECMKKNYRPASEIEEELKNVDLGNFLDFDYDGRYDFGRC